MSNYHQCTLARLRPELAAEHPSIPSRTWYPVLSRNPSALTPQAEPGLVWVKVDGRRRKLPAAYFKFARPRTHQTERPNREANSRSMRSSSLRRSAVSVRVQSWSSHQM